MKTFKYIIGALILTAGMSTTSFAQIDRSKAPEPGPAPEIQLGSYESFTLDNGLKVFVIENHKLPRISYQMLVDYDPIMEGDKAGYVEMAGSLLRAGTTSKTKDEIDEAVDFIGASLSTNSNGFFASCLTKHNDALLGLASDVLMNPTFPDVQLEKERKQMLAGLKQAKNNADQMAGSSGSALRYGKEHPYGEQMTEETVANVTVDDCKKFYNTYFKPNISYLVIVGDITKADAEEKVKKYFGSWAKGEVPTHVYKFPKSPEASYVAFVDKPGAVQSVINVTYPIDLQPGSDDAIAAQVMNNILGGGVFQGRLMQNLREDKAFTYGARSSLRSDQLVGNFRAFASVRNEVTDSSVHEFMYELQRMLDEDVSEASLSMTKNQMNGSFARSLERPQTIARFALNIERYGLQKNYYSNYLKKLERITVSDIKRVAQKYMRPDNAIILVVGNKEECAEKLEKFGEVKFFDMYGNEVKEEMKPAPDGMTGMDVHNKHLEAVYGTSNYKAIMGKLKSRKDITMTMGMEIQGMSIKMVRQAKYPNMYVQKVSMNGNVMQKEWVNKKGGGESGMQGEKTYEGDELAQKKREATMGSEANYAALGYKLELLGIEKVNKKEAYKVKVTSPEGEASTEWYDVASGFKIQTMSTQDGGPMGEMTVIGTIGDYKDVNGIFYPHTLGQQMGPQEMEIKVEKIETNTGLKKSIFK